MMRYTKGPAPAQLTSVAATPGMTWDGIGAETRDPIRAALVRDQGYLCAYCQRRIDVRVDDKGASKMKIEHWTPRSISEEHHFKWSNLLGVCVGTSVSGDPAEPGLARHCDTSRGNAPLFLHPVVGQGADPREHLQYTGAGEVKAAGSDQRAESDIRTLNLNAKPLRRGRVEVLELIMKRLKNTSSPTSELKKLARANEIIPGRPAPEHAEVVRYYVIKKLRQLDQTP
jgi:uncharacterized protein (TIGR02646 family)